MWTPSKRHLTINPTGGDSLFCQIRVFQRTFIIFFTSYHWLEVSSLIRVENLWLEVTPLIPPPIGAILWLLTEGVNDKQMYGYAGTQILACNCAKGVQHTWGVTWTCIHIPIHVHILTKVRDPMRGGWDTQLGPYRSAHVYKQLSKGGRVGVECQMDMHTCTNACSHATQRYD